MQHFFVTPDQVTEEFIYIEGSDVNHMKNVLRMKAGEELYVSDGNNKEYLCKVEDYEEDRAILKIVETKQSDRELPSKIWLFQGLPKGDKMEWIVQKAVELGARKVVPVATKRAVVKLDAKKAVKKVARWNEIAKSASKQAGRGILPEVADVVSFKEALQMAKQLDVVMIPYELASGMDHTREVLKKVEPGKSVGIFIGPEGGFDVEEVEEALAAGAEEITLGHRILRTETAGLMVLSVLVYQLEK